MFHLIVGIAAIAGAVCAAVGAFIVARAAGVARGVYRDRRQECWIWAGCRDIGRLGKVTGTDVLVMAVRARSGKEVPVRPAVPRCE
jgi:hypothetical protein